jgi:thiamine-monophosphate kinase
LSQGEFGRIALFLKAFQAAGGAVSGEGVPLGPGDDAAILRTRGDLAVTTDAIVEDVHFRRRWATWEQIGHKALAVNLSDLAAMGATPVAFTCAFLLPENVGDDALKGMATGMARLAHDHGVVLAGGNFSRARELSVTITAFGQVGEQLLRRDTAKPGDVVVLIGELGVAAAELRLLEIGLPLPTGRSAALTPTPLIAAGRRAAACVSCGIDISDGLVQDLGHIAESSGFRIRIDYGAIPRSGRFHALADDSPPADRAHLLLAGGEDYALVVIGSPEAAERLRTDPVTRGVVIGRVESGAGVVVDGLPDGTDLSGHDHFVRG